MHDPPPSVDPGAVRTAAALTVGPAVFLAHFAAIYGINALACAFAWPGRSVMGLSTVQALVAVVTAAGVVAVLVVARRAAARPTGGAPHREYDQHARREFVAKLRAMIGWLAAAAMVFVAVPAFLGGACA
jgi:hypothetical protein